MKRFLQTMLTLLILIVAVAAKPSTVLASEGDGAHMMEVEVNGYHVTLVSQNDWEKGENTIVVTLMDSMGSPVKNADVEILIAPKSEEHDESEMELSHGAEEQHINTPGMDMNGHAMETSDPSAHEEETAEPIAMMEAGEHGVYAVQTHLESAGVHEVNVMFHVNGQMVQATFVVEVPEVVYKTVALWGFVIVNVVIMTSAGLMKKQALAVKGRPS